MIYRNWLDEWLETCVKPARKSSTYDLYKRIAAVQIIPRLGGFEMDALTAAEVQKFTSELAERYSPNTVGNIVNIVRCSLKRAQFLGLVKERRALGVQTPKPREKEVECFTRAEQKKIENYAILKGGAKLFGIQLCLYTGLRVGEIVALEWSDFDMRRGRISVCKTCRDSWQNGKYVKLTDAAKTAASARIIPVPHQFLPVVRAFKKSSKSNYVICDKNGNGVTVRGYQRTFELLQKKLGIRHRGFHALRHTFATRAIECGVDVKSLSEIMGHENPMLTLKRYTHALMPHKTAMMNKLGRALLAPNFGAGLQDGVYEEADD